MRKLGLFAVLLSVGLFVGCTEEAAKDDKGTTPPAGTGTDANKDANKDAGTGTNKDAGAGDANKDAGAGGDANKDAGAGDAGAGSL